MARIIMKSPYLKPNSGGGKHRSNYAKYIATREGVELAEDTTKHLPATVKQEDLVRQLMRDFPDSKELHEYQDYKQKPTRENASELISRIIEANSGELMDRERYARYIAERPGVEKLGKHGLFTDEGVPIVLDQVERELAESQSNVWTHIISLHREDAARLGYDSAEDWMNLLRSKRNVIAQQMRIKPENFRWYAAFHDAGHHPHVHMIAYSIDPREAYLTEKGIETIKGELAKEIFRQDHLCIYQKQTQYRDQLREQGRESVAEIVAQINNGGYSNSKVEALLVSLSDRLSRTSGKKVYGYLKADVKAIVDEIVAELAADERIRKLYDLWYEQREDVLRSYTDHFPARIPLEQNKEFKTIRNAVIQEAMKIVNGIQQAAELEPRQDMWDVGLPPGGEPDMDAMADPGYWMERFQPGFTQPEPMADEPDPVDMEQEDTSTTRSSDSKEWWSDYYKLARRFLYGTKTEKPDFQKALPLLLLEANRGNGYACYDIGRMHLLGQGCEEDEEEAQRWFRDALEAFQTAELAAEKKGYLRYRIGKCHAYGHGTEQNYEESARWFRKAVNENNPFAAYSLGGQYLRGQGVEQSDTEAYSLFYMAATHEKQPNAYAQYQLGKMYRDGIGTEVDLEESSLWYARAYAGFLAMEETMADDRLYYRLGSMNMTGTGTEVNLEQARYYFEKAAELGNADALYGLGKLYLKPEFPDYDPAKAVEYLEQAAAKGNAFAKYQLGKLLCQGELVPKDIARGLPLLEELAQNGVTFASYIAGKVYLKEEGWQDIKKAILYFRQAAEDGNSFAEYQLGRIYYFGNGVRVDREKGLDYLKESAAHGNEYAANLLQTIQQQHTWGVASCTASLIAHLGKVFQEKDQKQSHRQRSRMDRKLRREIEEKKMAMGIRD
ncbi:MAG: SEL1-like repeat protein [Oscillospiraceae bacterium]|nr:SEL1-like repeat protein [Oscillospiraceae bacterium]